MWWGREGDGEGLISWDDAVRFGGDGMERGKKRGQLLFPTERQDRRADNV